MNPKSIEIWADSFHEGVWCCDNLCCRLSLLGYVYDIKFKNGFIPEYIISLDNEVVLNITVYGSYRSWNPVPDKIDELIDWGKPDFVAYSPEDDRILFAVEETAAVPTGNQATQRCERQYGSARFHLPYWYFISEYGEHIDGGVRRDSIWPTIAAIKLTRIMKSPCIVLHYSDADNVEDYNSGNGLALLFEALSAIIDNYVNGLPDLYGTREILARHYTEMISFVLSQWENVIEFLPSEVQLQHPSTAYDLADVALGTSDKEINDRVKQLLVWPLVSGVPSEIIASQVGKDLLKYDHLSQLLEDDITTHKCYILSANASSGKPPRPSEVENWVQQQSDLAIRGNRLLSIPAPFVMKASDFPFTESGNKHITTSKNVVYLYDKWSDLKRAIMEAYPRLKGRIEDVMDTDAPVFLYKSCTVKPGRLFGDPFTGQLSAFSTAFGEFDTPKRHVIVYFPHQVYTQAFTSDWQIAKNKGTTLYTELVDYIIFNAGVMVSLKTGEII